MCKKCTLQILIGRNNSIVWMLLYLSDIELNPKEVLNSGNGSTRYYALIECNDRHLPIRYNGWATEYNMEVTAMNKYVSLDKRSKKAQREYHAKQRRTWGELNPVTRSVPSGKTYNRKKEKQRIGKEFRNGFDADLFYFPKALDTTTYTYYTTYT